MKKPKITQGKWEVGGAKDKSRFVSVHNEIGDYPTPICRIIEFDQECYNANAKAISALPQLLSEAYSTYLMLRAHPQYMVEDDQEFIDRVEGLEEALEKAGYEF